MVRLLRARRAIREERGAAAVEFALIALVLFLLLFGIINFGVLLSQQLALNHAVREGARAAVVQSTGQNASGDPTAVRPLVIEALSDADGDSAVIGISTAQLGDIAVTSGTCPGDGGKQDLRVTADYTASLLAPMPVPGFPTAFDLTAEAVFKCEW